jgi:hypothetical protein
MQSCRGVILFRGRSYKNNNRLCRIPRVCKRANAEFVQSQFETISILVWFPRRLRIQETVQIMGMELDLNRVLINARKATTEDLLDRVTVYRPGMEPAALRIIREELFRREVTAVQIDEHERMRRSETLALPDGTAERCSFCHSPAVAEAWGWHRLWGKVPVFPRLLRFCKNHRPDNPPEESAETDL